jgi:DNA repair protein RecO (recombination protein O)
MEQQHFCIDLNQGGIVCRSCPTGSQGPLQLSKGTIKQLQWLSRGELTVARRIRFSPHGIEEATRFLEAFVPYHIGRTPKSLAFLHQLRSQV